MAKNNKKGKASAVGWILWILAVLVLVIIFIANKSRIEGNLKSTNFFGRVFGKNPEFLEGVEPSVNNQSKNDVEPFDEPVEIQLVQTHGSKKPVNSQENYTESYSGMGNQNQAGNENLSAVTVPSSGENAVIFGSSEDEVMGVYDNVLENDAPVVAEQKPVVQENKINPNLIYEPNTTDPVKSPTETPAETVSLRLYFIEMNEDGTRNIKEVRRQMKKTSTPLTDSINALIDGPTSSEEKAYRCRTMVSPGTRLLSASVSNGIATLNFSEDFEFNNYGIEGVMWELDQIVYTATAFPSVEKVQFLIEGVHREYISDGLRIGSPLDRNSL